jgi:hypothetical protein
VPGGGTTGVAGVVVKPGLFVLPVVVLRICGGVVDPSDGVVKSSAVVVESSDSVVDDS